MEPVRPNANHTLGFGNLGKNFALARDFVGVEPDEHGDHLLALNGECEQLYGRKQSFLKFVTLHQSPGQCPGFILLVRAELLNVRYWHKADIRLCTAQCPLSGVKRTCLFALQMSAFDPKRTSRTKHLRYTMMVSRVSTGVFIWPFAGA